MLVTSLLGRKIRFGVEEKDRVGTIVTAYLAGAQVRFQVELDNGEVVSASLDFVMLVPETK